MYCASFPGMGAVWRRLLPKLTLTHDVLTLEKFGLSLRSKSECQGTLPLICLIMKVGFFLLCLMNIVFLFSKCSFLAFTTFLLRFVGFSRQHLWYKIKMCFPVICLLSWFSFSSFLGKHYKQPLPCMPLWNNKTIM